MALKQQQRTLTQPKRIRDPISNGFTLLIILSLLVFNVLPLLKVLVESFRDSSGSTFSLMGYVRAFQYKQNREAIVHTLVSSTLAAALSTILGFLFAYCSCYVKSRTKKL